MLADDFRDICNKSVPVYILSPQWKMPTVVLYNYVYLWWFRPYRSELDWQRFMCKFIKPQGLPGDETLSDATVDTLIALNEATCAHIQALRPVYDARAAAAAAAAPGANGLSRQPPFVRDHQIYIVQPLFHTLMMVVCPADYRKEDSATVGRLPVVLVRTGIEDGLSAPITFESIIQQDNISGGNTITTTLEGATDFVVALEAREAATFGLRPDSSAIEPRSLSYIGGMEKKELLLLPAASSASYVDDEDALAWGWCGSGVHYDSVPMPNHEKRAIRKLEIESDPVLKESCKVVEGHYIIPF
ncbi:hypothetical protein B0T26DRAFT_738537 [Lasiosphaeria miniovina]|uniref:Uncharacterized protein n=1 Tax=Lasiosphaeria miniovina TaxID=1954250 RepID=A0AA40E8M6_9PEZI|nr:uncharacterized protein B0T26DRAFT_738537 [Lasiosphaeria miniovina]KAK0728061.1 hypothetical protein B0T26DRAFT_738537 [Lasiosphaeria miniovina]